MSFLFLRPSSPSKRQAVGSVVSTAVSTPAAPAESGGSGSARGQSTSGQSVVPRFVKPKKFVLKHSSQLVSLLIDCLFFFSFVLRCRVLFVAIPMLWGLMSRL